MTAPPARRPAAHPSNLHTGDEGGAAHLEKHDGGGYDRAWLEQRVQEALRRTFRPEFRNRIDEVIVFEPLGRRELLQIIELQLGEVRAALAQQGLALTVTSRAREALLREGFSPVFGARPLRRTIQTRVLSPLATRLLREGGTPGDRVVVGLREGRFTFTVGARAATAR